MARRDPDEGRHVEVAANRVGVPLSDLLYRENKAHTSTSVRRLLAAAAMRRPQYGGCDSYRWHGPSVRYHVLLLLSNRLVRIRTRTGI